MLKERSWPPPTMQGVGHDLTWPVQRAGLPILVSNGWPPPRRGGISARLNSERWLLIGRTEGGRPGHVWDRCHAEGEAIG